MVNLIVNASLWLALTAVAWVLIGRLTEPARALGLTLFRPWRGEHWPIGVQEDDDARFNWRAGEPGAAASTTPRAPGNRVGARPRVRRTASAPAAPVDGVVIEEFDGEGVAIVHVGRVKVHAHRG